MDFDDLDEIEEQLGKQPALSPSERQYGIVVYGATGFTGQLISQHLDFLFQEAPHPWALAGRDRVHLEAVRAGCATQPDILVAKSVDEVQALTGVCRVIISAAGPHALVGEPVLQACVENGTHYVDISGDCVWYKEMIQRYDEEAQARGVMLVIQCAMQSVPADLCVYMLLQHLGPLHRVRGYMVQLGFTSGGTDANFRNSMQRLVDDPWLMRDQLDPFSLGGARGPRRDIDEDCATAEQDVLFPSMWLGPLGCAASDVRAVRRSCALFEKRGSCRLPYGDDFSIVMREPSASKAAAERCAQQTGAMQDANLAQPSLEAMLKGLDVGLSPPPGAGPPEDARKDFYTTLVMTAEGESGRWATCTYTGGENYEVTAVSAAVGALTLLEELPALRPEERGGVVTPAFAFAGSTFVERLQQGRWAGTPGGATMRFATREGKPEESTIKQMVAKRTKDYAVFMARVQRGDVKVWQRPLA